MSSNRLALTGRLTERDALRHTPAGVPIVSFRVVHEAQQIEAGAPRDVSFEMACVAVEDKARLVANAPLGIGVSLQGFIASKGRSSRQLVLHVDTIEFR